MPDNKLEQRLDSLEQQVRFLMERIQSTPVQTNSPQRDWRKSVGMFNDRPIMKEIDAEGIRIREEDRERAGNDYS